MSDVLEEHRARNRPPKLPMLDTEDDGINANDMRSMGNAADMEEDNDDNDDQSEDDEDGEEEDDEDDEEEDEHRSRARRNSRKAYKTGATPSQTQFYPEGWTEVTDNAKNHWRKYLLEEDGFPKRRQVEPKIKEILTAAIAEYNASGGELEEGNFSEYQFPERSCVTHTLFFGAGYYPRYLKGMVKMVGFLLRCCTI